MKIEYLRKIMARIQSQIHCPKCKAPFVAEQIEIKAVKGNLVEFTAQCECCSARSQISAEIGSSRDSQVSRITKPKLARAATALELPTVKLDTEKISALKGSLQKFRGQDISDLFQ